MSLADQDKPQSWWQTLPGVLTGIAAVLTALGGFLTVTHQLRVFPFAERGEPAPRSAAPAAPSEASSAAGVADLSGTWLDVHCNAQYEIHRDGEGFRFTASGSGSASCAPFSSNGTISVTGSRYRSEYQGAMVGLGAIGGVCSGTLSAGHDTLSGSCQDGNPGVGAFATTISRQL